MACVQQAFGDGYRIMPYFICGLCLSCTCHLVAVAHINEVTLCRAKS